MADYFVDSYLAYQTLGASPSDPNSGVVAALGGYNTYVFDPNNDGDVDSGEYYAMPDYTYTGYTAVINGHTYAIFEDTFARGDYYIPFNSSFDDISSFTNSNQWTFQNPGYNAVVANCFLTGTQISTPTGERKVEDLTIGDLILTASGDATPVKWVGHQTFCNNIINLPLETDRAPICITKGALGNGLPKADLYVTADHGMIVDDLLINAGALVNGTTIRRVPLSEMDATFTVYHVETENHDVILANGAEAESFIDYLDRKTFDNYAEYAALYGDEPVISEMPLPRISSRRQLPADIAARFGISDFGADVTGQAKAFLASRTAA